MSLSTGSRLGPYEILSPLGAGGMGEVYRARDTRLNRDVAIKILPEAFAEDPERLARFQREAQVLASLNHPHIAHIHGLEEAGTGRALVLELVEGETLADRIAQGPFPLEEALEIARQIALALEAAHARGIVHRDLKPANVKITPEGTVKVLDFGLAKALTGDASSPEVSHSPTLTAAATQAGVVIGTAAYMSPEQARGRSVDKRADIWAFGAVLYEMLAGRKVFEGETVSDTLAAVLKTDPDWSRLPGSTPVNVRKVLKKCLDRDREKRIHDIADARIELEERAEAIEPVAASQLRRGGLPAWIPWAIAGLALAGLVATFLGPRRAPSVERAQPIRASIAPPREAEIDFGGPFSGSLAMSPDGRAMVFSASGGSGDQQLWLRRLDAPAAEPIPGTEGALYPFWSPDSRQVAFFLGGRLRKVPASGGPVVEICETTREPRGGAWGSTGVIVFASHWRSGLSRVSAEGGKAEVLTHPDEKRRETTHRYPFFLPDGKHFVYLAGSHLASDTSGENALYLGSLDSPERTLLVNARSNVVHASGHLIYVRGRSLVAQPLDLGGRRLVGEATPLVDGILYETGFFQGAFSASQNGLLAYQRGGAATRFRLVWFDRSGKELGTVGEPGTIFDIRLSPDGRQLAIVRGDPGDVWVRDLTRGVETRVTFHPLSESTPIFTPDSRSLFFSSDRDVNWDVYRTDLRAGGGSGERPILRAPGWQTATDISPDGKTLLIELEEAGEGGEADIWRLPLEEGAKP
ncbi:MAG TPA: protein kinase, partial [Thermoanaerobaculia bacterium]